MQFEKLSHEALRELMSRGYNILSSNDELWAKKVVWFPETVTDIKDYLMQVADEEATLLVIDDALNNLEEEELIGDVFMISSLD